jgi:four helix bundle protein
MESLPAHNMLQVNKKVPDFTDLIAWKTARILRANVYTMCREFPRNETFGLSSQMRRAVVAVTADLAEGCGRSSYQENMQFCRQSRGSVYELRDHLTTALDGGYITLDQYKEYDRPAISVATLINGYIRAARLRPHADGSK